MNGGNIDCGEVSWDFLQTVFEVMIAEECGLDWGRGGNDSCGSRVRTGRRGKLEIGVLGEALVQAV